MPHFQGSSTLYKRVFNKSVEIVIATTGIKTNKVSYIGNILIICDGFVIIENVKNTSINIINCDEIRNMSIKYSI